MPMKVSDFRLPSRRDFRALLACESHEDDSRTGRSKREWIQEGSCENLMWQLIYSAPFNERKQPW